MALWRKKMIQGSQRRLREKNGMREGWKREELFFLLWVRIVICLSLGSEFAHHSNMMDKKMNETMGV